MSKRFGRNQRRRMRAEVENLKQAMQMDRALLRRQRSTIERQAEVITRVSDILGEHFAGLEPKDMQVNEIRDIPMPVRRGAEIFAFTNGPIEGLAEQLVMLESIAPEIGVDPLQQRMHVYLRTRRGDVAYGITEEAMMSMPRQHLVKHIAVMTASYLVEKLPCSF